jgi:fibro-slime domain-containing protein
MLHARDAFLLLVPLGIFACEGRTSLHLSPCQTEGETRSCSRTCGEGVQTCTTGVWGACVLPPMRLPCSNTCGQGTQLCEDDQRKGVCEVEPVTRECSSPCGSGVETCVDNHWLACTAPRLKTAPNLAAKIRDFHTSFPDMNHDGIAETGIVEPVLGRDDKPVYAHEGETSTVYGPETFQQWFRDVDGVNVSTTLSLPLTPSSSKKGVYSYSNNAFFPIDGQLFGNEEQPHNYAFTVEIAASFRYHGGETFTFSGDDDVFVFINRQLAIDLGGIHSSMSEAVDLDAEAKKQGLVKGETYAMHIFFAERHMTESNFVVETTISEFDVCE